MNGTPGSPAALEAGCVCPVAQNNHGRQLPTNQGWWVVIGCPVHNEWWRPTPATPSEKDHT